ncbi:glycosyltransferase [Flagellimonas lutimaris]|uniref:glycosyltransferase n=1 Tax=Flagellimonas lutimaris TaxID=475082 RepID=UPI003F5CCC86
MHKKYKVFFVIPSLRAGGAERVMSFVAQNLDQELFETTLVVIGSKNDYAYSIDNINLVFLEKSRVLHSFPPIFSLLRKQKPDIVISAIGHVNAIMAFESIFFKKVIFIGREVNVISVLSKIQSSKKWFSFIDFTKYSYKLLDIILCQSKDMANDMQMNFDVPSQKIRIINNPISKSFAPKEHLPNNTVPKFITVGSLVERKGHLRILKALLKYNGPFEYTMLGDGNKAEEILNFAKENKIEEYVKHIPFTKNVSDYLKEADVFLQGSYVEGFPNALLESCATGTPAIVYKALGGIDEIIEDGLNGYIVENEIEFIEKLNLILKQKLEPTVVSSSVLEKFNSPKILKKYENLFLELLQK